MPQRILFTLFQALVLSVIDYGLGLLTLSSSQLHRLNVIQNEGMRTILGCTRDTATDAMRYVLDLPDMAERHIIGWAYSARINDEQVHEDAGAFQLTTSSMDMKVKAIRGTGVAEDWCIQTSDFCY